jgi:hypothetical protein
MKRGRLNLLTLVWAVAIGSLGCSVAFRADPPEGPFTQPPSSAPKPSIAVVVRGKGSDPFLSPEQDAPWHLRDKWTEIILEAYRESNRFSSVRRGFFEADRRVEIEVRVSGEANGLNEFFSLITLFVVPLHTKVSIEMSTVFQDTHGETLATIEFEERLSRWEGMLLLPIVPFHGTGGVLDETLENLSRSTLAAAGDVLVSSSGRP